MRWEGVVAVVGLSAADGRTILRDGRYSLRPHTPLRDPRGRRIGTVASLYFRRDNLCASGILRPGLPELIVGMVSGALRPQLDLQSGQYAISGEQTVLQSGTVTAVTAAARPTFPRARFHSIREVDR